MRDKKVTPGCYGCKWVDAGCERNYACAQTMPYSDWLLSQLAKRIENDLLLRREYENHDRSV